MLDEFVYSVDRLTALVYLGIIHFIGPHELLGGLFNIIVIRVLVYLKFFLHHVHMCGRELLRFQRTR